MTASYTRVDPITKADKDELDTILDGGSIELNSSSDIKAAGTVPFIGSLDLRNDYLRIYSESFLNDETTRVAHGTFLVATPSFELHGDTIKGRADLYSLLQLLSEASIGAPLSLPAGTIVVDYAKNLVEDIGLSVIGDYSDRTLNDVANFDAGTSLLEVVNWLLAYGGFSSADVDGYGNVLMARYQDPSILAPVVEFTDGKDCVFLPGVLHEQDFFNVPNQVIAIMSNMDRVMTATAINADPNNRYSTIARGGRTITQVEQVSDIASQDALQALAEKLLSEKTSAVETIEIKHVYQPFRIGDAGRLNYSQAGFLFIGVAVRSTRELSVGMPCTTRFNRFVRM
ncbi:MAG: hypothetical protein LBG81_01635 [Coriobacteriaceae bacterium]|nr:hypothetical protein [Coriobacteriaceae bacterium]